MLPWGISEESNVLQLGYFSLLPRDISSCGALTGSVLSQNFRINSTYQHIGIQYENVLLLVYGPWFRRFLALSLLPLGTKKNVIMHFLIDCTGKKVEPKHGATL